ncbi:unnamed protein product [Symbiodinium sp. CCMP2592]|nr:unnamed protein product [Symbiodinium sp. CCMP2592]
MKEGLVTIMAAMGHSNISLNNKVELITNCGDVKYLTGMHNVTILAHLYDFDLLNLIVRGEINNGMTSMYNLVENSGGMNNKHVVNKTVLLLVVMGILAKIVVHTFGCLDGVGVLLFFLQTVEPRGFTVVAIGSTVLATIGRRDGNVVEEGRLVHNEERDDKHSGLTDPFAQPPSVEHKSNTVVG